MANVNYKNANAISGPINRKNVENLQDWKNSYAAVANEQLGNIAAGDNWNPWLTMKRTALSVPLWLAEKQVEAPASGISSPLTGRRESAWESLSKQAEAAAQSGQPFKPDFRY